jgi:hypothetical protein
VRDGLYHESVWRGQPDVPVYDPTLPVYRRICLLDRVGRLIEKVLLARILSDVSN